MTYTPTINARSPNFPRSPWVVVGEGSDCCLHRHHKHPRVYRFEWEDCRSAINFKTGRATHSKGAHVSYGVFDSPPPMLPMPLSRLADAIDQAERGAP